MHDMVEHADNWVGNLQRYTASIASTVLYGWRTPNVHTGYVKGLIEVSLLPSATVPDADEVLSGWTELQRRSTFSQSTFSPPFVPGIGWCLSG